jgi:hypothetical protein
MIALAPDFLTGSYPPLITPFRDGRVDYETYARLIEFQITNGHARPRGQRHDVGADLPYDG